MSDESKGSKQDGKRSSLRSVGSELLNQSSGANQGSSTNSSELSTEKQTNIIEKRNRENQYNSNDFRPVGTKIFHAREYAKGLSPKNIQSVMNNTSKVSSKEDGSPNCKKFKFLNLGAEPDSMATPQPSPREREFWCESDSYGQSGATPREREFNMRTSPETNINRQKQQTEKFSSPFKAGSIKIPSDKEILVMGTKPYDTSGLSTLENDPFYSDIYEDYDDEEKQNRNLLEQTKREISIKNLLSPVSMSSGVDRVDTRVETQTLSILQDNLPISGIAFNIGTPRCGDLSPVKSEDEGSASINVNGIPGAISINTPRALDSGNSKEESEEKRDAGNFFQNEGHIPSTSTYVNGNVTIETVISPTDSVTENYAAIETIKESHVPPLKIMKKGDEINTQYFSLPQKSSLGQKEQTGQTAFLSAFGSKALDETDEMGDDFVDSNNSNHRNHRKADSNWYGWRIRINDDRMVYCKIFEAAKANTNGRNNEGDISGDITNNTKQNYYYHQQHVMPEILEHHVFGRFQLFFPRDGTRPYWWNSTLKLSLPENPSSTRNIFDASFKGDIFYIHLFLDAFYLEKKREIELYGEDDIVVDNMNHSRKLDDIDSEFISEEREENIANSARVILREIHTDEKGTQKNGNQYQRKSSLDSPAPSKTTEKGSKTSEKVGVSDTVISNVVSPEKELEDLEGNLKRVSQESGKFPYPFYKPEPVTNVSTAGIKQQIQQNKLRRRSLAKEKSKKLLGQFDRFIELNKKKEKEEKKQGFTVAAVVTEESNGKTNKTKQKIKRKRNRKCGYVDNAFYELTSRKSLLHYASAGNQLRTVKFLVQHHDMNLNWRDMKGFTPLHIAVRHGVFSICRFLLYSKCEVDSRTYEFQDTPLHMLTVLENPISICELLLYHTADVNQVNKENITALELMKRMKNSPESWLEVEYLLEKEKEQRALIDNVESPGNEQDVTINQDADHTFDHTFVDTLTGMKKLASNFAEGNNSLSRYETRSMVEDEEAIIEGTDSVVTEGRFNTYFSSVRGLFFAGEGEKSNDNMNMVSSEKYGGYAHYPGSKVHIPENYFEVVGIRVRTLFWEWLNS